MFGIKQLSPFYQIVFLVLVIVIGTLAFTLYTSNIQKTNGVATQTAVAELKTNLETRISKTETVLLFTATPTPTLTPTPTYTPTPTFTSTPIPTPTLLPTATPIPLSLCEALVSSAATGSCKIDLVSVTNPITVQVKKSQPFMVGWEVSYGQCIAQKIDPVQLSENEDIQQIPSSASWLPLFSENFSSIYFLNGIDEVGVYNGCYQLTGGNDSYSDLLPIIIEVEE